MAITSGNAHHRGHRHLDQFNRTPRESDADRIRKFLEALGQPPTSTPPPPVASRSDIPPRRLAPVQPPPVIPGMWRLPREHREKPDVSQREITPIEQPGRLPQFVPPPVPSPAAPAFEVHEAFPVERQQPSIIKTAVDSDAGKQAGVAKRAGSKKRYRHIARIEIWFARGNPHSRNFRTTSRFAGTGRDTVAVALWATREQSTVWLTTLSAAKRLRSEALELRF